MRVFRFQGLLWLPVFGTLRAVIQLSGFNLYGLPGPLGFWFSGSRLQGAGGSTA